MAGLSPDLLLDLRELTQFPFMVNALEASTLVAIMAAIVGWFMVLRRESFAGHTLSVMSFPGASGALALGVPPAAGYFGFCALCAAAIAGGAAPSRNRAERSAVIGAIQAFGLACGYLFLNLYHGVLSGYENLLFGNFLGITRGQVLMLLIVCAAELAFFAAVGRALLFASVDGAVARARGVPVRALSLAFLLALGLAVAATAQITGALLVFALLVAPAATSQLITHRIGAGLLLSVLIAVAITWAGLSLAYFYQRPVGFYISAVAFAVYVTARLARLAIEARFRAHPGWRGARREGPC